MALFGWSPVSTLIVIAIVLFFLMAILNKFINMGIPFNKWIAWPATILPFIVIGKIWSIKYGVLIGLIVGLICGVLAGYSFGPTESED